jgi:putative hydrolase of the HAD superfamily
MVNSSSRKKLRRFDLPSVLLLDLDDTIVDNSGGRDECWRLACIDAAAAYPGLDAEDLHREIDIFTKLVWSDPEWHREWRMKIREAWQHIAGGGLAALDIENADIARMLGDRHFELRNAAMTPLPGAIDTLNQLKLLGVTLGLITNGASAGQRAKIERFALAGHFDYIGIEGEVGHGKPDRGAYQAAIDALEANASDTWMVGDKLDWDVAGAQSAGILGIWLDKRGEGLPPESEIRPDRIIRSIAELVPSRLRTPTERATRPER